MAGHHPGAARQVPAGQARCPRPADPRGRSSRISNECEHGLDGLDVRDRDPETRGAASARRRRPGSLRRHEARRRGCAARPIAEAQHARGRRRSARSAPRRVVGALLERPARVALGPGPVAREDVRLEDPDRAAPTARRRVGPALVVALARAVEPLARFCRTSLHDEREPGAGGRVPECASAGAAARRRRSASGSRDSPSR